MGVRLYTDGACLGNPGPGGWGVLVEGDGASRELSGGEAHTTNNRMEIRAAIEGLRAMDDGAVVTVVTDSTYVKNGITSWIRGWKRKGWRTSSGSDVKNRDLWEALDGEVARREVRWEWVKGHAGHPGNEAADALASREAQRQRG